MSYDFNSSFTLAETKCFLHQESLVCPAVAPVLEMSNDLELLDLVPLM